MSTPPDDATLFDVYASLAMLALLSKSSVSALPEDSLVDSIANRSFDIAAKMIEVRRRKRGEQ